MKMNYGNLKFCIYKFIFIIMIVSLIGCNKKQLKISLDDYISDGNYITYNFKIENVGEEDIILLNVDTPLIEYSKDVLSINMILVSGDCPYNGDGQPRRLGGIETFKIKSKSYASIAVKIKIKQNNQLLSCGEMDGNIEKISKVKIKFGYLVSNNAIVIPKSILTNMVIDNVVLYEKQLTEEYIFDI